MKEARRIYEQLTQVSNEQEEIEAPLATKKELPSSSGIENDIISSMVKVNIVEPSTEACSSTSESNELPISSESDNVVKGSSTPLHEAVQSGNALKVLELLEQGLDPCARDERGQTPYMVANEKEVRNTFRRFMASNLDKWDWNAAKVPSALTKEMEESQAAKQVIICVPLHLLINIKNEIVFLLYSGVDRLYLNREICSLIPFYFS